MWDWEGKTSGWNMAVCKGIQYKLSVFTVCINLTESDEDWEQLAAVYAETLPHVAKNIRIRNAVSYCCSGIYTRSATSDHSMMNREANFLIEILTQ